jgi:hypothetical protein
MLATRGAMLVRIHAREHGAVGQGGGAVHVQAHVHAKAPRQVAHHARQAVQAVAEAAHAQRQHQVDHARRGRQRALVALGFADMAVLVVLERTGALDHRAGELEQLDVAAGHDRLVQAVEGLEGAVPLAPVDPGAQLVRAGAPDRPSSSSSTGAAGGTGPACACGVGWAGVSCGAGAGAASSATSAAAVASSRAPLAALAASIPSGAARRGIRSTPASRMSTAAAARRGVPRCRPRARPAAARGQAGASPLARAMRPRRSTARRAPRRPAVHRLAR